MQDKLSHLALRLIKVNCSGNAGNYDLNLYPEKNEMKKLRWLGILMMFAILGITGFQAWWLKQTYDREEKTLELKTQTAFVSTVHHLQAAKLKLDKIFPDSLAKGQRIIMRDNGEEPFEPGSFQRDNVVITVNALQNEMKDTVERFDARRSRRAFPEKKIDVFYKGDSTKRLPGFDNRKRQKDFVYVFLTKLDSLQDSLKVNEISAAYSKALKEQKTEVPFAVVKLDSVKAFPVKPIPNEVTLGFKHPITYKMQLGNTFPYLLKQIIFTNNFFSLSCWHHHFIFLIIIQKSFAATPAWQ